MAFTNRPVDPAELPPLDDQHFVGLESAHLRLEQARWLILGLGVLVGLAVLSIADVPTWLLGLGALAAVILAVVGVVLEQLAFAQRGWLLRDHDISSKRGLIARDTTTAPFVRVQHVTVSRGALERLFGLARLRVFTAGAAAADLVIVGLSVDAAEQLKETVLVRSGHLTGD